MTLLWAPWLVLAALVVLLRRALGLRTLADASAPASALDDPSAAVAQNDVALVTEALRQAHRAHAAGATDAAQDLFACARAGALVLLRDLESALGRWSATTWSLDAGDALHPLPIDRLQRADLRLLAALDARSHVVLASDLVRLRLRLFVLRRSLRRLSRDLARMEPPVATEQWRCSLSLSADLATLTRPILDAHASLRAGRSTSAPAKPLVA